MRFEVRGFYGTPVSGLFLKRLTVCAIVERLRGFVFHLNTSTENPEENKTDKRSTSFGINWNSNLLNWRTQTAAPGKRVFQRTPRQGHVFGYLLFRFFVFSKDVVLGIGVLRAHVQSGQQVVHLRRRVGTEEPKGVAFSPLDALIMKEEKREEKKLVSKLDAKLNTDYRCVCVTKSWAMMGGFGKCRWSSFERRNEEYERP